MNAVGKMSLGVAVALTLHLTAPAKIQMPDAHPFRHPRPGLPTAPPVVTPAPAPAAVLDPNNPYATIVARNVFSLVSIPEAPPPPPPPVDPPPKITANGIMNVFGEQEALFKVSYPAKGSEPAKDQSYTLSVGERQDDIEVTKIDEASGVITFNNHDTIQEIAIVPTDKNSSGGSGSGPVTSGASQPPPPNPGIPGRFRSPPPGGGFTSVGGGGNPATGSPASPQQNNNNINPMPGGGPLDVATQAAQENASLTPEQQAVLIEAERARLETSEKPDMPPQMLPPTTFSAGGVGGPSEGNGDGSPPAIPH